jgi:hypothetical protein
MASINDSNYDTLLAEFYMDDNNRMIRQEKRALEARNNTAVTEPNTEEIKVAEKTDTKGKVAEKPPFDSAAFYAWAKGPVEKEKSPSKNNKKSNTSPFRLRTF